LFLDNRFYLFFIYNNFFPEPFFSTGFSVEVLVFKLLLFSAKADLGVGNCAGTAAAFLD
jgi:hypothetical protein